MHSTLRTEARRSFISFRRLALAALLLGGGEALRAQENLTAFQIQENVPEIGPILRKGVSFGTNRVSFAAVDDINLAVSADQTTAYLSPPDKSYTVKARFFLEELVSTNLTATFQARAVAAHPDDAHYFTGQIFAGLGAGYRYDFTHPVPPPGVPMNESVVFVEFPKGYAEISLRAPAPKLQEMHITWVGILGSIRFEPEIKAVPAK